MRKIIDIEDDIFQAHCALDILRDHIEDGAVIRHVREDVVTLDLYDGSESDINLGPIQHLVDGLRGLK